MKKLAFLLFALTISAGLLAQQQPPFREEMDEFRKADSLNMPPARPIVFTGSSSIRKWTGIREAFPGYPIINRGFGGSTFPDVVRYTENVIIKYHPRQIVLYCGDNDLASNDSVTAQVVFRRFTGLFHLIRSRLKDADILYISIKPSPSRERLMPRIEEANNLISEFLHKQKHAAFVDVYHAMLTPDGRPMDDIFESEKLHMNAKGYEIWQKIILPYLDKP
jgi:lysophospholipase L1-like esterase